MQSEAKDVTAYIDEAPAERCEALHSRLPRSGLLLAMTLFLYEKALSLAIL
jgi:hypothetical protein